MLTNLGVVLGLVLLAYQIYLDRKLTEALIYVESYGLETDRWLAELGENPTEVLARAAFDPVTLKPEDYMVLEARVEWYVSMMRRNAIREKYGLRDSSWRTTLLPSIGKELGSVKATREILLRYESNEDWMDVLKNHASEQTGSEHSGRILEYRQSVDSDSDA